MIIVSLTSFGERLLKEAPIAINSIMNNSMLPDKIVLVVDKEDLVPSSILNNSLIEVIISDLDIKGHNKYYHTIQKYPEAIIILIDDDMQYQHNFIEECVKAYEQNPKVIHACRVHKILYENEHILSYKKWEWDSKETRPSFDLFFTGCGGVVLFPEAITKDDVHISEIYKYITVDDILLNTIVRRKRIKVQKINTVHKSQPINILHNKFNLSFDNLKYKNDEALRDICFENILNKLM